MLRALQADGYDSMLLVLTNSDYYSDQMKFFADWVRLREHHSFLVFIYQQPSIMMLLARKQKVSMIY